MPPLTLWDPAGLPLNRPRVDLADLSLSSPAWSCLGNKGSSQPPGSCAHNVFQQCKFMNVLTSLILGGFIFHLMWLTLPFDCFWINENLPIAGKLINHKCRNGAQVVTQEHWESNLQFVPIFSHFQTETFALGPSFYLVHRIESGTLSKLNPSDLRWSFLFFFFFFKLWFWSKGPCALVNYFLFSVDMC